MFLTLLIACSDSDPKSTDPTEDLIDEEEITESSIEPPENGLNTFEYDDLERQFRIHIPENLPEEAPLVIVIHGYSSAAEVLEGYSGMNALGEEEGFVVVYPQGTEDEWGNTFFNVGYDFHASSDVDDVGYITALFDYLQESLELSASNVFSMGMSNGGDMSYLLACQSDKIRAIAPVAGCMMKQTYDSCEPSRTIPVLAIHGTEDDITLVDGDMENQDGWGPYLPLDDVIQFWVAHNQLELSEVIDIEDTNTSDGSTVVHHRYYTEADDTEVSLYEVIGGGHDWPGAFGNEDIDSSQLAWAFFSGYLE